MSHCASGVLKGLRAKLLGRNILASSKAARSILAAQRGDLPSPRRWVGLIGADNDALLTMAGKLSGNGHHITLSNPRHETPILA
jgi:hypothetical protein